jgi:hypothetical protein
MQVVQEGPHRRHLARNRCGAIALLEPGRHQAPDSWFGFASQCGHELSEIRPVGEQGVGRAPSDVSQVDQESMEGCIHSLWLARAVIIAPAPETYHNCIVLLVFASRARLP